MGKQMAKRMIGYLEFDLDDQKRKSRENTIYFHLSDDVDKKILKKDVSAFIYKADNVSHFIVNEDNYKKYKKALEENKEHSQEIEKYKKEIKLLKKNIEDHKVEIQSLSDNLLFN